MRRRGFLAGLAGLTGVGVLAAGWKGARSRPHDTVIRVLRTRLDYLTLDEAGVRRFADELVARGTVSASHLHLLASILPLYERLGLTGGMDIRSHEERICTAFLLSSDFFSNGMRQDRTVSYVTFHDPIKNLTACSAPFARPVIF
jgi:hypothetical protein